MALCSFAASHGSNVRRQVVGDALERRAHGLLRQRQPEEDGLAGAVTGLADGSGIDDDGIPAAGFERFVEWDGSERTHTVEEARPMGVTEDADVERSLGQGHPGFQVIVQRVQIAPVALAVRVCIAAIARSSSRVSSTQESAFGSVAVLGASSVRLTVSFTQSGNLSK